MSRKGPKSQRPASSRVKKRVAVSRMHKYGWRWLSLIFLTAFFLFLSGAYWLQKPLDLKMPAGQSVVDVVIPANSSAQKVVNILVDSGVQSSPRLLLWWMRLSGQTRDIRAGTYELGPGLSPYRLLEKLVTGDQALRRVTILEGWTFHQMRQTLAQAEGLVHSTSNLTTEALMDRLGMPGLHPEGRFFPDTYVYAKGSEDWVVWSQARDALQQELKAAWEQLPANSVLKSPDDVLKLASIIEKETNHGPDRFLVSGVFHNRLRLGMKLQTDPTIIYGLGENFDGNLRRSHLRKDGPYNTYTRAGLPPTPIALVGRAALEAAVKPAKTSALYFVSKGDGTSQFSSTLIEHELAVEAFILKRRETTPEMTVDSGSLSGPKP